MATLQGQIQKLDETFYDVPYRLSVMHYGILDNCEAAFQKLLTNTELVKKELDKSKNALESIKSDNREIQTKIALKKGIIEKYNEELKGFDVKEEALAQGGGGTELDALTEQVKTLAAELDRILVNLGLVRKISGLKLDEKARGSALVSNKSVHFNYTGMDKFDSVNSIWSLISN